MAKGQKTGGRKAGVPNKVTQELKEFLRPEMPAINKELVRLATKATNETVRIKAIEIIYERFHGKVPQAVTGPDNGPVQFEDVNQTQIVQRIAHLLASGLPK